MNSCKLLAHFILCPSILAENKIALKKTMHVFTHSPYLPNANRSNLSLYFYVDQEGPMGLD